MKLSWTFKTAAAFWRLGRRDPNTAWDQFVSAETFLLDHDPATFEEVSIMLEIVSDQGGDGRTDGRDVAALVRAAAFLKSIDATPVRSVSAA